jgi:ATP-dependent Clp protease adaptor protein ClpS
MTKEIYKELNEKKQQSDNVTSHELLLINDEYHSFDYVIDALIEVCNHTLEQAEQCTTLTHYKGQCAVMKGELPVLRKARKSLVEKELRAVIE